MKIKPFAAATMFLAVGAATIWFMHVQEAVVYPSPENLIQQSRQRQATKRPAFASKANAKLTLHGPNSSVRLTDPIKLVVEFESVTSEEFYITTNTNTLMSGDTMPDNFRLITDDHCARRVHTSVDTFLDWSEEEWLANRAILLLDPHQSVSLPVNLRTWGDLFCTLGKHRVHVIYQGNSLSNTFSHPFLATPLTSADVQITIQP